MGTQDIYLGNTPNDKTGTPARQAGSIINANFNLLAGEVFKDTVLKTGEIEKVDLDISIAANAFAWRINLIEFLTPPAFTATLDEATPGYYRYDLLQGTNTGAYLIKSSDESETLGTPPIADEGCIALAAILVLGDSVADITPAPTGQYVEKKEVNDVKISYGATAVINEIQLNDVRFSMSIIGAITDIKSVRVLNQYFYDGKPHFVKNHTGHALTIWHMAGTGNLAYSFANGLNYVLQPNETLEFTTNGQSNKFELIGSSISTLIAAKAYADAGDVTTLNSAKTYADGLVVGLLDDRGNYDASTNLFPSSGGSGASGAILKGDLWTISVVGTLGGVAVTIGDVVRSLSNTPGQTSSNWVITKNEFGYVAENSANKSNSVSDASSTTKFPVWNIIVTWIKENFIAALPAKSGVLVDADLIICGDSADSFKTKTRTFAQLKANLIGIFQTIPSSITNSSVTGTYNLDYLSDTWVLTLTGTTTFTESNLPASGKTKVISLYVTGNFALTYPSGWTTTIVGTYAGALKNQIVVEYLSTGNYWVTITQP